MNKVFGKKTDFAPIREDASRVIVSYGYQEADEENATWFEVYFYKKKVSQVSLADVKEAIIADINSRTDLKILNDYEWTIMHGNTDKPKKQRRIGETVKVWLSMENQNNFKEAHRLAAIDASLVIPVKFKIGEDEEGTPVYETFESFEELNQFYVGAFAFVKQTIDAGWAEKDSIDWAPYEALYPQPEQPSNVEE